MPHSISTPVIDTIASSDAGDAYRIRWEAKAASLADELRRRLDSDVVIIDAETGVPYAGAARLVELRKAHAELCRRVADRGEPELAASGSSTSLLVLPLGDFGGATWLALAETSADAVESSVLLQLGELFVAKLRSERDNHALRDETRRLSEQIGSTFEEISLIYRLTQSLSISRSPSEIGTEALQWLEEVVSADGFAVYYEPIADADLLSRDDDPNPVYLTHGRSLLAPEQFVRLIETLDAADRTRPIVLNHGVPNDRLGEFAALRQLVLAPLREGNRRFGWIAAFNRRDGGEFGSGEAGLLASIASILGMHSGNVDLYRQQAELFSGVVRAMSSAIDAKDPYTRGHSDRVARVSVRLAQELGCDEETLRTIYLAGLLHDVGKIGIDDNVLRKPGKLTEAEYEHIKAHVEIGHRILRGLKKMGHVLPIVLHHHESWDGTGYPHGLSTDEIPYLARIVAVADAYDAMSSDRPYRKGMPDEKLDAIFRSGAGKQWDPAVIDAFFRVRGDIRRISHPEPDPADAVAVEWAH